MLQGPGKYWLHAAALGKDKDSSATALGAYSGWVEFNALNVELDIADTADEADDVVCVNGSVNVKTRLIGPAGVSVPVAFATDPATQATVSPASANMTVGTDENLTLTGQQASDAVNDTDLIAKIGTCQIDCETEDFTVCKVEIKDGEDETKDPGKFVCVGNTTNFQAKITPSSLSGQYEWTITQGKKMAEIEGVGNAKIVTVKGLEASKKPDDVKIKLKFKPDGAADWCSPVFHEFTILKVELDHAPWWFNGENPGGGYHITSTLTVTPVTTGTFKWDVIAGADKVDLNNGGASSDSITATDDNTVTVTSTAPSAAAATVTKDVRIQLTYNGAAVCTYDLAVFAPHTLTDLTNIDHDYSALPTPPYPDNPGYWCEIKYKIRDQFNQVLPYDVPWNEDFNKDGLNAVTGVSDYPGGDNWGWGPESGWTVPPSAAIDNLARPNPPCSTPPAQNVGSGTVKVDHEIGGWYIGSATIGKGVLVKDNCKWQFYQDHARHE